MIWVYFEENLNDVEDHAFVDCNSGLVLHYGYDGTYPGDPTFNGTSKWREKYIATNLTDLIPIESDHVVMLRGQYPGLIFSIKREDIYRDCWRSNGKSGAQANHNVKIYDTNGGANKYASVYQWIEPTTSVEGYYNVGTGDLTIPNTVRFDEVDYPVRVIESRAFEDKTQITSLTFKSNLIQICNRAFYKCTGVNSISFSECTSLKEIGNGIFFDAQTHVSQANNPTNGISSLTLPNSLEYVGKYAFYNLKNCLSLSFKTNPDAATNLKVIGGYAFANMGYVNNSGSIVVTIPSTLDDSAAKNANINVTENYMSNKNNYNAENYAAVGPYSFGSTYNNDNKTWSAISSITMDATTNSSLSCSLAPNAFARAIHLTRFKANDNLYLMGSDVFKDCKKLKEVFLTTAKAAASGKNYPWGTKDEGNSYDQGVFNTGKDAIPDLVVYIDGATAPGRLDTMTENTGTKVRWNSEQPSSFINQYGDTTDTNILETYNRTCYPTLYNIDYDTEGNILYYNPSSKTFVGAPTNEAQYNDGVIVFAKQSNNKYTAVKYFTDDSNDVKEIDLTGITKDTTDISANLTTIGPEAFATHKAKTDFALYIILPDTVTEIKERAFYKRCGNDGSELEAVTNGTRIVTYKSGGTIKAPDGTTYAAAKSFCETKAAGDNNAKKENVGYCILPNSVTRIEKNAFYGNIFGSVVVEGTLTYLGKSAFTTYQNNDTYIQKLTSISIGTSTNFEVTDNGIYYKGNLSYKTLLYLAQGFNGALTLPSNTKAIGMHAAAGGKLTSLTINDSLTTIYGNAFRSCRSLTTVNVNDTNTLQYISSMPSSGDPFIYDTANPCYDITDMVDRLYDYYEYSISDVAAFRDCTKLKTLNFKKLTSLKKIGHFAFYNNKLLDTMVGTDKYSYYSYTPASGGNPASYPVIVEDKSDGILDLSPCTNLRVIGQEAFGECYKIKYAHLPYTDGQLYVSRDPERPYGNGTNAQDSKQLFNKVSGIRILVGDKAIKACSQVITTTEVKSHYSNVWYGSNTIYFYAANDADLLTNSSAGAVRYWTKKAGGGYILFSDYANAHAYFTA